MERKRHSTGTEWEAQNGYSRAVRAGDTVHVAGTTAVDDDGAVVAPGDPYEQTRHVLDVIADALAAVDAGLEDVVRTRMYVTDMDHEAAVGRAHGEVFGEIRPAATMVAVEALVDPALVVEVEATAQVG